MDTEVFVSMLIFSVALYGTPGPATLSLAASGASFGFRRSLPFLIGIISGVVSNYLVVALGLAYLFINYPSVYAVFKYVSLVYVLYLAYRIATSGLVEAKEGAPLGFGQGVVLNLLNPKAYIASLAVISQFTSSGSGYFRSAFFVGVMVAAIATVIDVIWCYSGEIIGRLFSSKRSATALNFVLAIVLALSVIYATFFVGS